MKYSIFNLLRQARDYHKNWPQAWRSPDPKSEYDVIIIGGGGHGLATAYYLAKEHGITNVAVLEKGWLGGGNTGRNTTIVRSNYLWDQSANLYDKSLQLFEGLSQDLNYNVMFSARGVINLAHNEHDLKELARRGHACRLNGIDYELVSPQQIKEMAPIINISSSIRYPVLGGAMQRRAGNARHDAVAWGYARRADEYGIDIIQNCEVTGIDIADGKVTGVQTTRGAIKAKKVGAVVAGHASVIGQMAGLKLPVESHALQAMVTEPIKPLLDTVLMSNTVHVYISQSDKGELVLGAGIDGYNSYGQRGGIDVIEHQLEGLVELYPIVKRLRIMRTWGGIVDICPDASPIISKTTVDGFFMNCGWGTGGFKATPGSGWTFAHTIAQDRPHKLNEAFDLKRFETGLLIDEHGAAAVAH